MSITITAHYVDLFQREVYPAAITIADGKIQHIEKVSTAPNQYILPGFIDAHIHIESSMLVPTHFASIALKHGTVATVSDPHEIANVCGMDGVLYMLDNAKQAPLKFNFGAPSCVPSTPFENAGAVLDVTQVSELLAREDIKYLSEMMNFTGVLQQDAVVMDKIAAAKAVNKPIDGHAPGLSGALAHQYAAAGISTDHECTTLAEALDKIAAGMYILIREGSAAKNYEALAPLIATHPQHIMFCSDDKHPDELLHGHINELVKRAIAEGYPVMDVLYAACIAPILHYKLDVGMLRLNDAADFIVVDNLTDFNIDAVFINGEAVVKAGKCLYESPEVAGINHFSITPISVSALAMPAPESATEVNCKVIQALDHQLITESFTAALPVQSGFIQTDTSRDLLKIGVVNRYTAQPIAMGFVHQFGLQQGAIASSVAHDSHNIVFVGVDDQSICDAVNAIIQHKGGISIAHNHQVEIMALPIAGLMTDTSIEVTATAYKQLDQKAKQLGSTLTAPFMTLSFMALPVIPALKITDMGLFDVNSFQFTDLF